MRSNASASVAFRESAKTAKKTYGGGFGAVEKEASAQLMRQVATCLLWEDTFYEKGSKIAAEIAESCSKVSPEEIARIAVLARSEMNLRHVPLFLVSQLEKRRGEAKGLVATTLPQIIQRADELAEFLAVHAKVNGKKTSELKDFVSAQVKKGLAAAFQKFNPYALAKYNRDSEIKLRDVLFLCHAKPKDEAQKETWKALVAGTLDAPDTWEVALSAGKDKKETWERLLTDGKLGDLALLRNLRNMTEVKVDRKLIQKALRTAEFNRVLPFRFLAAASAAPGLEGDIDNAMLRGMSNLDKLPGRTLFVVDISGSMGGRLSGKSMMDRRDAAAALAILFREVCEDVAIYATAGDDGAEKHATALVPPRRGKALAEAIRGMNAKLGGGGIFLTQVTDYIAKEDGADFDRSVIITDEQDCDRNSSRSPARAKKLGKTNYILNVAPYSVGLAVKDDWTRINGFSERVVDYIRYQETGSLQ